MNSETFSSLFGMDISWILLRKWPSLSSNSSTPAEDEKRDAFVQGITQVLGPSENPLFGGSLSPCAVQHLLAHRFEFSSRLPFRKRLRIGHSVAYLEE